MIGLLRKLFGLGGPAVDISGLMANGAQVVDVRTPGEFASGHLNKSINIPLNELSAQADKLKKDKPVITCCASGMRSAAARKLLRSKGFTEVYNGGSWMSLRKSGQ